MLVRFDYQHEINIPTDVVILIIKSLLRDGAWADALSLFFVNRRLYQLFHSTHLMPNFDFPLHFDEANKAINVKFDAIKHSLLANLNASHSQSSSHVRFFRRYKVNVAHPAELSLENLKTLRAERDLTAAEIDAAEIRWNKVGVVGMFLVMLAFTSYSMYRTANYGCEWMDVAHMILFAILVAPISNSYGLFRNIMIHQLHHDKYVKLYQSSDAIVNFFDDRRKRLGHHRLDLQEHFAHLKAAAWDDQAQDKLILRPKKIQSPRFFSKAVKMEVASAQLTDNKMAEFMLKIRRK